MNAHAHLHADLRIPSLSSPNDVVRPRPTRGTALERSFVAFLAVALGCGIEAEDGELEDPTEEIVENLRLAGHPAAEIVVHDDGTVVVGGDAVVSLQASREMIGLADADEGDEGFRQYRTTNQLASTVDRICVNGSAFTGTLSTALDDAIANFTDMGLSFDIVRTTGMAMGCDALITANLVDGTGGSAGFPAGGMPYGTIDIGDDIEPSYGVAAATHVITHELGHCVGFRHTDYFNRSISCGGAATNEGDAGVGAVHVPGTPTGASYNGSVMNSCYNAGSTGVWTANDVTALQTLYPAPVGVPVAPNPLVSYSDDCWGLYLIDWASSAGATTYQLHRSSYSTFSNPAQIYSGTTTHDDISVPSGTWYLRARACNVNGCSGWTNQVSATRLNYCNP